MENGNKTNGMTLKFKDTFTHHLADAILDSLWLFNMDYCDNEQLLKVVINNLQCYVERKYYADLEEEFYNVYGEEADEEHHIMKLAIAMKDTFKFYKIYV